jgi:predicted PurR-regulated permease PerM
VPEGLDHNPELHDGSAPLERRPSWIEVHASSPLAKVGVRSWLYLGIAVWAVVLYSALAALSGLVIPLVISIVLAVIFAPLIGRLSRGRIPRRLAGALVMVGLLGIGVASVWVTVRGIVDQASEIGRQLAAGINAVAEWVDEVGIGLGDGSERVDDAYEIGSWLLQGLAGSFSSVFSSAFSLLAGTFIGLFLLYYLLADWDRLVSWVSQHLAVPVDLARPILGDTMAAIREYFYGLTISSLIVAVVIGVTMLLLGLPLAFTIAIVTFVTAYVPYLGAIFSGAFAFLVALGSGGPGKAFVVLAVVLIAQNAIQTLVQNKLTSDRLRIHPIVNFGSTIVGASLAGVLGATLSAPAVAAMVRLVGRVRAYDWEAGPDEGVEAEGSVQP